MSLLIDALKKHRLTSTSSLADVGADALKKVSSGRTKKIVLVSLVTVIVVSLTATASFLIFKHLEKKRITQSLEGKIEKVEKVKALLEKKSGELDIQSEAPIASEELRQKLKQEIEQKTQAQVSASETASVAEPATAPDSAASIIAPVPRPAEVPRARLAAHKERRAVADNQENSDQDNTSSDQSNTSNNSDDDANNDASKQEDIKQVNIQVVPDQLGANNSIYQKALGFMQVNQYDKALLLLENNNDLLLKTQGLSALLLARIYLATGSYELADQVLDNALTLHVGSEMDLLALRAQALFMQKKYQETVELLSSQSPDLSSFPGYYALLADAYMHLDQANNAVSVFQQIVARFPNSPDYWLGLAVAYEKTGDAASAMVAYRRAAQLSPDDPQVTLFINQQLQALQTT